MKIIIKCLLGLLLVSCSHSGKETAQPTWLEADSAAAIQSRLESDFSNRDYPVVQAIIVLVAGLVVTVNFLVDLLYGIIDPRIEIRG